MTEYWVSQAKYHCKICNCYMADNKMSRQHHENSVRHKINFDKLTKEKKNQQLKEAHAQRELRETLQQIEKAAREAMIADGSSMFAAPAPPPQKHYSNINKKQQQQQNAGDSGPVLEEEQNTGFYTIDGKTYLDGTVFQQKLRTGRECEVFVEELDDWYPGIILSRRDVQVPNTNIVLVSFEVQYKITLEDGSEETTQENGVKSDRLRMIANEEQDPEIFSTIAEEEKAVILPPPPPAPLDENTGVSVWQTVSVTVVNEDEEYESHKRAVEEMYSNKKVEEKIGNSSHISEDSQEYQPKTYKGIVIEDAPISMSANHLANEDDEDGRDHLVAFKKRKIDDKTFIKTEENSGTGETKPLFKQMKAKNFRKK